MMGGQRGGGYGRMYPMMGGGAGADETYGSGTTAPPSQPPTPGSK